MTNRRVLKSEIIIKSPSRLHLGFYGIPESYGYTYGSMGLAIDYAPVILSIKNSSKFKSDQMNNLRFLSPSRCSLTKD